MKNIKNRPLFFAMLVNAIAYLICYSILEFQYSVPGPSFLAACLISLLCYNLYKGKKWARNVYVAFSVFAILMGILGSYILLLESTSKPWMMTYWVPDVVRLYIILAALNLLTLFVLRLGSVRKYLKDLHKEF